MGEMTEQFKHKDITAKVIGAAMQVHKVLGTGFQEVIYQRARAIEMEVCTLGFSPEYDMPIFYREQQIGNRRVDFLVENEIPVELKLFQIWRTSI